MAAAVVRTNRVRIPLHSSALVLVLVLVLALALVLNATSASEAGASLDGDSRSGRGVTDPGASALVQASHSPTFRLGYLRQIVGVKNHSPLSWQAMVLNHLSECFSTLLPEDSEEERDRNTVLTYRALQAAHGLTLNEHADGWLLSFRHRHLSHILNTCSAHSKGPIYTLEGAPVTATAEEELLREVAMHASLALFPQNEMTVKNLAYDLEWQHYLPVWVPLTLIEQSLALTGGWTQSRASAGAGEGAGASASTHFSAASSDPGLLVQRAFSCQTYFRSAQEAFIAHVNILARAEEILLLPAPPAEGPRGRLDPSFSVRDIQLNPQYLGISPGVTAEAYGMCLQHLYPSVTVSKIGAGTGTGAGTAKAADARARARAGAGAGKVIRLGIVSEHESNSSPGLILTSLFQRLSQLTHSNSGGIGSGAEPQPCYELVFFYRTDSITLFTAVLAESSREAYELQADPGQLDYNRDLIAGTNLDILVYIALPTEKFTSFLSHSRLAPVQVVFGIGHPLTSGISSVDYSIVSADMFASYQSLVQGLGSRSGAGSRDVRECLQAAVQCRAEMEGRRGGRGGDGDIDRGPRCQYMRSSGCAREALSDEPDAELAPASASASAPADVIAAVDRVVVPAYYTEQLVVFDSLAYYLADNLDIYSQKVDPLSLPFHAGCAEVNALLLRWGLGGALRAEELGCVAGSDRDAGAFAAPQRTPRTAHLYACIQIPRKMHTSFDAVLVGILRGDPRSKVLMDHKVRQFFPRWLAAGLSQTDIDRRIILMPRLAHVDYMRLLSLASVFLNTFPFGAGITSSEALSLCVPVVVYAEMSSVLHLALAQVRKLGSQWERQWVAHSTHEYVRRAIALASIADDSTAGTAGTGRNTNADADLGLDLGTGTGTGTGRGAEGWLQYRQSICRDRPRINGPQALEEAVQEWHAFLQRVGPHAA